MGDRANVMVREPEGGTIYLYTHYSGYEWPERLREALANCRDRWDDESYLTRCLATSMFADLTDNTGGGISTYLGDNDHPIIIVDVATQVVAFAAGGSEADASTWFGNCYFDKYVAQERAEYPTKS